MIEENLEKEKNDSNIDRLLYLKQQRKIVEEAKKSTEKFKQIIQLQRKVTTLSYEKWEKMEGCVETVQEDIDWYVKEYIIPIQERQQELDKLENSLISIPEKHGIVGRVGKFFERFIPGITKEGRQKKDIEEKRQTIEDEIETYKTIIARNPFQILGANKDIKSQLLEKIDVTQLDKYSTMKNEPKNYLKRDYSVKSIVDNIKRDDMMRLLNSYPALKGETNYLINELINNGLEAFNNRVGKIAKENSQSKEELIHEINFEMQENNDKDILNRITQEIQSLMSNLTPEELQEVNRREKENTSKNELEKEQ